MQAKDHADWLVSFERARDVDAEVSDLNARAKVPIEASGRRIPDPRRAGIAEQHEVDLVHIERIPAAPTPPALVIVVVANVERKAGTILRLKQHHAIAQRGLRGIADGFVAREAMIV